MQKKKAYAVSTAHLDTVWRWDLRKTIEEYLPDTLRKNFDLIERYPDYCFNFEGAFRYQLIEEYYPLAFAEIQNLVKRGNWYPAGACYENGDVNIPSPEALFRNILLGNRYFQEKFGVQSKDIFLPDCFGFGQALPSVMKYAGLLGFTTQKLSWGSAYGVPFTLGYWQGVDGSRVLACPNARSYRSKFSGDLRGEVSVIDDVAKLSDTVEGDEKTGVRIVVKALEEPVRQIAYNAGFDGGVIVDKIMTSGKTGYGFDAYNETFVDMMSAGIVDPTKVTRSALQNAASIASVVLTTESVVADKKDPAAEAAEKAAMAGGGMGGGMY